MPVTATRQHGVFDEGTRRDVAVFAVAMVIATAVIVAGVIVAGVIVVVFIVAVVIVAMPFVAVVIAAVPFVAVVIAAVSHRRRMLQLGFGGEAGRAALARAGLPPPHQGRKKVLHECCSAYVHQYEYARQ